MVIGTMSLYGSRSECNCNELKYGLQLGGGMTLSITLMSCVTKHNCHTTHIDYHPYTSTSGIFQL